jgi:hypothetical protein
MWGIMPNLPNIEYKKPKKNPTVDSETSRYELPFYKDVEYLSTLDNFVSFIKAVEQTVRRSKEYKRYIKYIRTDIGLNFCGVLSNIQIDDEKALTKLEMHHGPILTLFDYASIITDYMITKNERITTFSVADRLLEEHFNNNIQVVMLSETVHEMAHTGAVFLNINHAFGNLDAFLKKYRDGVSDEQISRINKYLDTCRKYESFDKHALDLSDTVKSWNIYE